MNADFAGETSIFPAFPSFSRVPVPTEIFLTKRTCAGFKRKRVFPSSAYAGRIQPFDTDQEAALVVRDLMANRPVDVHGGYLLPNENSSLLPSFAQERRLIGMHDEFEVLIARFDHTPDPWAFITNPPFSRSECPRHPHPRNDREMIWNGKALNALCVYSAAEFSLAGRSDPMSVFLAQLSIFLAKHLIWLKTDRKIWLGKVALYGEAHLRLDIDGPCWCGDGYTYRNCCLAADIVHLLRKVPGVTVPPEIELRL